MRLRWILAVVTLVDLWLIAADLPKLSGPAWRLGHSLDDPQAPWWTWSAGLRGWVPPAQSFEWQAGWAWPLVAGPVDLRLWAAFVAVGAAGAAALLWIDRWDRARPSGLKITLGLASLVIAGWALEDLALAIRGGNPFQQAADLIQNPGFNGYFLCAKHLRHLDHLFSRFVAIVSHHPDAETYIQHPPGGALFFWLLMRGLEALPRGVFQLLVSLVQGPLAVTPHDIGDTITPVDFMADALGGQLVLGWAAALVVPCFFLARRLAGRDLALRLAGFALLIPSILLMSPTLDQTFAMLSASILALLLEGLEHRPVLFGVLAGVVGAVALFLSYAFWLLAFPVAAIVVARGVTVQKSGDRAGLRRAMVWMASTLAAALAIWLVIWRVAGFDFPKSLELAGQVCNAFNAHRPYRVWVWLDFVDFFQHLGPALVCFAALQLLSSRKGSVDWYFVLFFAFMLALDLTGWNRGEVARLWIFLMPLALLGLYRAVGRGSLDRISLASLAGAQFLVCTFMARYWKNFS